MGTIKWGAPIFFLALALLASCGKKSAEEASASASASASGAEAASEVTSGSSPVYNAQLSPQFASPTRSSHPAIREGTLTTLRFNIDLAWADSETRAKPNVEITNSTQNVPLTVTMSCDFCTKHEPFIARMTYDPRTRRSDTIIDFTFVPMRGKHATGKFTESRLVLSILNSATGREFDRIPIPVVVMEDDGSKEQLGANTVQLPDLPTEQNNTLSKTDVFLHVLRDESHGLAIMIEPVDSRIAQELHGMLVSASGKPRVFKTGLSSAENLQKSTSAAFSTISRLSLQRNSEDKLRQDGKDLSSVLTKLERMEIGRPVRLTIRTSDISLPWQYLHPQQQKQDPWQFWGIKFSLAVRRVESPLYTGVRVIDPASSEKLVFARYGVEDETTASAAKQLQKLRLLQFGAPLEVDSKEKLKRTLAGHRDSIAAIFTFLHAASGRVELDIGDGRAATVVTTDGPLLSFKPKGEDDMTSGELEELREDMSSEEFQQRHPYLSSAPLVVLNACETGM